jgi:hypothetical protein
MANLDFVRDFVNSVDLEEQREELGDARGLVDWLAGHRLAGEDAHASDADAAAGAALLGNRQKARVFRERHA